MTGYFSGKRLYGVAEAADWEEMSVCKPRYCSCDLNSNCPPSHLPWSLISVSNEASGLGVNGETLTAFFKEQQVAAKEEKAQDREERQVGHEEHTHTKASRV